MIHTDDHLSKLLMLDQDVDGNLVLIQGDQRIVLNGGQVNEMIDILLGPSKSKTITDLDIGDILTITKPPTPELN